METFLAQFQICAEHNEWSEVEKASQLKCCIVDEAGSLVWDSGKPGEVTYSELVEKLRRRYGFLDQQEKFEAELRARKQGVKETLAELYQEIRCMMLKAYPGENSSFLYERTAKEFFLGAMKDRQMASKVREKEPKDLETAFKQALRLEAQRKADESSETRQVESHPSEPQRRGRFPRDEGLARRVSELERRTAESKAPSATTSCSLDLEEMRKKMDEMSKEIGRLQALQASKQSIPSVSQPPAAIVYNNSSMQPSQNTAALPARALQLRCFNCGTVGHTVRFCPQPKRQEMTSNGNPNAGIIGATKDTKSPDEN